MRILRTSMPVAFLAASLLATGSVSGPASAQGRDGLMDQLNPELMDRLNSEQLQILSSALCEPGLPDCREVGQTLRTLSRQLCDTPNRGCEALDTVLSEMEETGTLPAELVAAIEATPQARLRITPPVIGETDELDAEEPVPMEEPADEQPGGLREALGVDEQPESEEPAAPVEDVPEPLGEAPQEQEGAPDVPADGAPTEADEPEALPEPAEQAEPLTEPAEQAEPLTEDESRLERLLREGREEAEEQMEAERAPAAEERPEPEEPAEPRNGAEEPQAPASALEAILGRPEEAEVESTTDVTITEETARSSTEDVSDFMERVRESAEQADEEEENRLIDILGAAAAGFAIGQILPSGDEVVETTGDRVILEHDGEYIVRKDENILLRRPGTEIRTSTYSDGSTRTVATRPDGTEVITIRDASGNVLYRSRVRPDGTEVVLINETDRDQVPIDVADLPPASRAEVIDYSRADRNALREALLRERLDIDRGYSLAQVRYNRELRELMPRIDLDAITFDTGSAAISPDQARSLANIGETIAAMIEENPDEIFLVEGHTDTVGPELYNLTLSDRRAESVALALIEYFDVPPENLVVQGYGEKFLKVEREGDVRANRRATVRRITPLLRGTG